MLQDQIVNFCNAKYGGSLRFLKDKMFINQFGRSSYDIIQQHNEFLIKDHPLSVKVYNYINNITSQPTCKMCSNPVVYNSNKHWLTYCCVSCRSSDELVIDKRKDTNIKKYGSSNYLASNTGKEKSRKSHIERYGTSHYNKTKEYLDRIKSGDIVRDNNSEQISITHMTNHFHLLADKMPLITPLFDLEEYLVHGAHSFHKYKWQCKQCDHKFEWWLNNGKTPICPKCCPKGTMHEEMIMSFLRKHSIEYIHNTRKQLGNNQEIDIYIPSQKLGIELNGLYYHQEHNVGKCYHVNKTTLAADQGIKLIQIFDDVMYQKKKAAFNFLKHELGLVKKINISNLDVKQVDNNFACKFHNKYNVLGDDNSNVHLGLYRKSNVVAVASFKICKAQTELSRFTQNNTMSATDGLMKIINTFIKFNKHNSIVCYVDRCWSDGSELKQLGFKHTKTNSPRYWYTKCFKQRLHRLQFQHKYQSIKLKEYHPELSESENMINNDYVRIFDCGTLRYELTH